ncbi:hypothetical protein HG536_0D00160 [Torulaspora globosa]|uniref:Uncharacterized protein n=1 Tax=Torulaspora globosa TaxID=48254 RepID=A0A7G3ZG58_9SACH|nr:uncharacterized protein HG536_0D00160 [Torulaspora globosa]QLL32494.1 hypothetical protein HG536_0D00160 [Torulaspora globosa]
MVLSASTNILLCLSSLSSKLTSNTIEYVHSFEYSIPMQRSLCEVDSPFPIHGRLSSPVAYVVYCLLMFWSCILNSLFSIFFRSGDLWSYATNVGIFLCFCLQLKLCGASIFALFLKNIMNSRSIWCKHIFTNRQQSFRKIFITNKPLVTSGKASQHAIHFKASFENRRYTNDQLCNASKVMAIILNIKKQITKIR